MKVQGLCVPLHNLREKIYGNRELKILVLLKIIIFWVFFDFFKLSTSNYLLLWHYSLSRPESNECWGPPNFWHFCISVMCSVDRNTTCG